MNTRHRLMVAIGGLLMIALVFFIFFSEKGLADLNWLKKQRRLLLEKNAAVASENRALSVEIERLNSDPGYIEQMARRKLGMIGRDELIVKTEALAD